jgi:phage gp29-like protein
MITAIEMLDRQISTSILVPRGLGVSTTDSGGGSFAKSQKEFDTFIWVVTQLRKELEAVINEQLVMPIMDLNYLVTDNTYPVFRFKEITDRKKREMFELWLDAVKGGALASTKSDRVRARELIDFPQPDEDEEQELLDKRAAGAVKPTAEPTAEAGEGDDDHGDSDHGHDVAGSTDVGKRSQSQTDDT